MKQFRNSRYWVTEEGKVFKHHPPRTYNTHSEYKGVKFPYKQKRVVTNGTEYGPNERWYEMKPTQRKTGYWVFNLQCPSVTNKGFLNVSVHQMVAECYIGFCPLGYEVDHIDGDKSNNHFSNLQYLTKEDNIKKSPKNWLMFPQENTPLY